MIPKITMKREAPCKVGLVGGEGLLFPTNTAAFCPPRRDKAGRLTPSVVGWDAYRLLVWVSGPDRPAARAIKVELFIVTGFTLAIEL